MHCRASDYTSPYLPAIKSSIIYPLIVGRISPTEAIGKRVYTLQNAEHCIGVERIACACFIMTDIVRHNRRHVVVLKVGDLFSGEDAAPRRLIERDRRRDRFHIGGQGTLVAPRRVIGRHRNLQAGDDLAEFIFKVLAHNRLADINLSGVQILLGLRLQAIRFASPSRCTAKMKSG